MSIVRSWWVGDGDMFNIIHDNLTYTTIDCCMDEENRETIVAILRAQSSGSTTISRFISTHPDDDHIRGLEYLNTQLPISNFYCVNNEAMKPDEAEDFIKYCKLRNGDKAFWLFRGCSRKWLNESGDGRNGSGINILWPVVNNPDYEEELRAAKEGTRYNNISPIIKYKFSDDVSTVWMGDLQTPFMEKIISEVAFGPTPILFAPHHGRDRVPDEWLNDMKPKVIILGVAPSTELYYYKGCNMITQNSAGHITIECLTKKAMFYVTNRNYSVDFLNNEYAPDNMYGKYIGSLLL
jgi:beta-lactamase superfamily II metal-dependent hydrolase